MQATAIAGLAVTAAIGPLLLIAGEMAFGLAALATAFTKTGIAAKAGGVVLGAFTAGPVALTIAALVGAGGLVAALLTARSAFDNLNQSSTLERQQVQLERWQTQLDRVVVTINEFVAAGKEVPQGLMDITQNLQDSIVETRGMTQATVEATAEMERLAWATTVVKMPVQELGVSVGVTAEALREMAAAEADLNLDDWPFRIAPVREAFAQLPPEMSNAKFAALLFGQSLDNLAGPPLLALDEVFLQVGRIRDELAKPAPPTFFESLRAIFGDALNDLNRVFMAAFEGGGLGGAVSSLATTIVSRALQLLDTVLPGLGTMLSKFAGAIVSGFKAIGRALFGGPGEAELAGRAAAQSYRDEVVAGLTEGQIGEAVASGWDSIEGAKFFIGLRDMFLEVGGTAAQAEAAFLRLWKAEKGGAEEVDRVLADINRDLDLMREKKEAVAETTARIRAEEVLVEFQVRRVVDLLQDAESGTIDVAVAGLVASGAFATAAEAAAALRDRVQETKEELEDVVEVLEDLVLLGTDAQGRPIVTTQKRRKDEGGNVGLDITNPDSFQMGTPRLDFQHFGRATRIEAHGPEALIPQGSGHLLAAEIAAAMPRSGIETSGMERRLDQIEGAVRGLEDTLPIAFRDALIEARI